MSARVTSSEAPLGCSGARARRVNLGSTDDIFAPICVCVFENKREERERGVEAKRNKREPFFLFLHTHSHTHTGRPPSRLHHNLRRRCALPVDSTVDAGGRVEVRVPAPGALGPPRLPRRLPWVMALSRKKAAQLLNVVFF